MRQSKFHRDIPNNTMIKVQQFSTLYHTGKSGAIYSWNIWTEGADIVTLYGQIDGKKQIARKTATAKNVGRSNETSPKEQAILEATAMHKFKLDRKYSETIEEAQKEIFLPMLATSFDKRKHSVDYPMDVQPKLDGVRCMAYWEGDSVRLMSRNGKSWNFCEHIQRELEEVLPKGSVLDGELYIHGATFQEITKLVKKSRKESENVEYHVYDVPRWENMPEDATWEQRFDILSEELWELLKNCKSVVTVTSYEAKNEEDVYKLQSDFLEEGYEGAIVRALDGEYRFGYRSRSLLKVKNFMDEEYEIVNFTTGVGKFEGCIVWICVTENGEEFKVVPQGSMEERKELYDNAKKHIGRMLKVKFFELTDDGIPRFPVGLGIRLTEDM